MEASKLARELLRMVESLEITVKQIARIREATADLYGAMQARDEITFVDLGGDQIHPWSETTQRFLGIAVYKRKSAAEPPAPEPQPEVKPHPCGHM